MKKRDRYRVGNVDLAEVRNRNEVRVVTALRKALEELGNPSLSEKSLCDAYALALNLLPARYAQRGTIVLREPIREAHVQEAVGKALSQVLVNPKE